MKIICGYVEGCLRPETRNALMQFAPKSGSELLNLTGNDYAYWEAVKDRWTGKEDLVIIEQDIVITKDTLRSFRKCKQDWCTFWYEFRQSGRSVKLEQSLGCVRFSARLQRQVPFTAVPRCRYYDLDRKIGFAITVKAMASVHIHGEVGHRHHPDGCATCDIWDKRQEVDREIDAAGVHFR